MRSLSGRPFFQGFMYGLKAVPFKKPSISSAPKVVPGHKKSFSQPLSVAREHKKEH
jgi:hypothetical protein